MCLFSLLNVRKLQKQAGPAFFAGRPRQPCPEAGLWLYYGLKQGYRYLRSLQSIWAIASKTVRSAVRSRVVHVILFFCLLTVVVVPLTIASDGTAKGLVQVSLTYTLGIIGVLLSLVAVWLGSVLMSEDIEGYQIHMVITKPVSRSAVWLGKWLGIVLLLGGILFTSSAIILGMTYWRLHRSDFSAAEMTQLRKEVLVGRRLHQPEEPNFEELVELEYQHRVALFGPQLPQGMTPETVKRTIRSQLERRKGEVAFMGRRRWVFANVPRDFQGETFNLRYRLYVDRVKERDQRATQGVWFLRDPQAGADQPQFRMLPKREVGGVFAEIPISRQAIGADGTVEIHYWNRDPGGSNVVLPPEDGPHLMLGAVGFWNNFARVVILIFIQVMFMATLGCACGATLSTPVAIFISFSYVFIGLLVRYMRPEDPGAVRTSENVLMKMILAVQRVAKMATVSLNDFIQVQPLTRGELVDIWVILLALITVVVVRGGIIGAIGLYGFSRRELGLVIRK